MLGTVAPQMSRSPGGQAAGSWGDLESLCPGSRLGGSRASGRGKRSADESGPTWGGAQTGPNANSSYDWMIPEESALSVQRIKRSLALLELFLDLYFKKEEETNIKSMPVLCQD